MHLVWCLYDAFTDGANPTIAGTDACATSTIVGAASVGRTSPAANAPGRKPMESLF
jgi:hypothetical protein